MRDPRYETFAARLHCAATWTCLQPKELAEEAVISEPVSARWFPVPGENTGKFADFGLESAKAPRLSEENSIAYQVNSLAAKAGKICERSGKPEAVNSESDSFRSTTNFE